MGSAFMKGLELVQLAARHGWADAGPGANHPYILKIEETRMPFCPCARQDPEPF